MTPLGKIIPAYTIRRSRTPAGWLLYQIQLRVNPKRFVPVDPPPTVYLMSWYERRAGKGGNWLAADLWATPQAAFEDKISTAQKTVTYHREHLEEAQQDLQGLVNMYNEWKETHEQQ